MQINDRVIVTIQPRPYDRARKSIGKIIGETKTSWRVEYGDNLGNPTTLFKKNDLHIRGGDSYSCTKISEWSDEEWKDYTRELLRRTVIRTLTDFKWDEVNTETLLKIHTDARAGRIKE